MPSDRNNLPGVLLIVLSALGILFGVLVAGGILIWEVNASPSDALSAERTTAVSFTLLALLVALLNIPTMLLSIRHVAGKPIQPFGAPHRQLKIALLWIWLTVLLVGATASLSEATRWMLIPLNIPAILLPIIWLILMARRGLPRPSPLRAWGTLTVSLTATPFLIFTLEMILLGMAILVFIILLGFHPALLERLTSLPAILRDSGGEMKVLEDTLQALLQEPAILGVVYVMIGAAVPIVEELLKPLAVWVQTRKPLSPAEAYSLGLVSGGAFALLESATLVSQLIFSGWLAAVSLRAITSILHIGLSGWVGYAIARSFEKKKASSVVTSLLGASALHGLWNSMALMSGFSSTSFTSESLSSSNVTAGLALVVMLAVLLAIFLINLRIHRALCLQKDPQPENRTGGA